MTDPSDDVSRDDTPFAGPPPNWREGRQRFLVGLLQVAFVVVVVCSAAALVLPESPAHGAASVMTTLLIAVPIVRVTWLLIRWLRLGDWRFAITSAALLAVIGAGALVATLT